MWISIQYRTSAVTFAVTSSLWLGIFWLLGGAFLSWQSGLDGSQWSLSLLSFSLKKQTGLSADMWPTLALWPQKREMTSWCSWAWPILPCNWGFKRNSQAFGQIYRLFGEREVRKNVGEHGRMQKSGTQQKLLRRHKVANLNIIHASLLFQIGGQMEKYRVFCANLCVLWTYGDRRRRVSAESNLRASTLCVFLFRMLSPPRIQVWAGFTDTGQIWCPALQALEHRPYSSLSLLQFFTADFPLT